MRRRLPDGVSIAAREPYVHEQISSVLFSSRLVFIAFVGGTLVAWLMHQYAIGAACAVLAATEDAFRELTTRVDENSISWQFTRGFPWGLIPLAEVVSAKVVRGGVGPWALAGYQAVAITKRDGRVVTVGTDEPAELIAAIEAFRGA